MEARSLPRLVADRRRWRLKFHQLQEGSGAPELVKPYRTADRLMRIAVAGGAAAVFLCLVEQIDLAL